MRIAASVLTLVALAGCQPATTSAPSSPAAQADASHAPAKEASLPIQMFEAHCFRPGADYKTIVAAAEAMRLKPVPKRLEPLVAPQTGKGRSFVLKTEKKDGKVVRGVLLGVSELNTCSVAAVGYDPEPLVAEAKDTYKLFSVSRDDVGLQVNEMFIPGGTSKRIAEAHEKGLVGIMVSKPGSGAGKAITLGYISPEAARQTFQ